MKQEHSAGVVTVYKDGGRYKYLLVQHKSGHWGFPKGHLEKGETAEVAARRELAEEVGVQEVDLLSEPRMTDRYTFRAPQGRTGKTVSYFIGRARSSYIKRKVDEIIDAHWFDYRTATAVLGQLSSVRILRTTHDYLLKHHPWS